MPLTGSKFIPTARHMEPSFKLRAVFTASQPIAPAAPFLGALAPAVPAAQAGAGAVRRRMLAWCLVLVCLFAALWPAWSHAVSARVADGAGWVQVCTTSGTAWVQVGDAPSAAPQDAPDTGLSGHVNCPWCQLHSAPWALPPAPVLGHVPPALAAAGVWPQAGWPAPWPLHAWSACRSRAPPAAA